MNYYYCIILIKLVRDVQNVIDNRGDLKLIRQFRPYLGVFASCKL